LGEIRESLEKINLFGATKNPKVNNSPNSDNNFPIGLVIGGGILVVVGLMAVLIIKKKSEKKVNL